MPGVSINFHYRLVVPDTKSGAAEYQPAENERGRVIRYKFAFQWCESQVIPCAVFSFYLNF